MAVAGPPRRGAAIRRARWFLLLATIILGGARPRRGALLFSARTDADAPATSRAAPRVCKIREISRVKSGALRAQGRLSEMNGTWLLQ